MIRTEVDLTRLLPIDREKATRIALVAGKYASTLTLESGGVVLNLKSMIGLLSQAVPKDGQMTLVAEGADEEVAAQALMGVFCP